MAHEYTAPQKNGRGSTTSSALGSKVTGTGKTTHSVSLTTLNIRFIQEAVLDRQRVEERLEHEFMNQVLPRLLSPCSPAGVAGEVEVLESMELMSVNPTRSSAHMW
jgi:hypothetical protein